MIRTPNPIQEGDAWTQDILYKDSAMIQQALTAAINSAAISKPSPVHQRPNTSTGSTTREIFHHRKQEQFILIQDESKSEYILSAFDVISILPVQPLMAS